MRTLTLDVNKWRCGGSAMPSLETRLGTGGTQFKNAEGFMCCLGQFAEQIVGEQTPLHCSHPHDLAMQLNSVYDPLFVRKDATSDDSTINTYSTTKLAGRLIWINDDPISSIRIKIHELKEELAKYDVELIVLNGEQYVS